MNVNICKTPVSYAVKVGLEVVVGVSKIIIYRAYTKEWCGFNSEHY